MSNGFICIHNLESKINDKRLIPLIDMSSISMHYERFEDSCYAICTDYPVFLREKAR